MSNPSHKPTDTARADTAALAAAAVANALLLMVGVQIIIGSSIGTVAVTTLMTVALMAGAFRALGRLADLETAFAAAEPAIGEHSTDTRETFVHGTTRSGNPGVLR
ncbi:hypothetical protein [Williamsia sp. 1135]|uniref:hypothetical protein n=1 Tax=Williamsia sp. 1135 TaxID=1889262 RepID=UPI00117F92C8|nr:hypothetical protein [Williamsia sp. 1135]